jgi:hypothetical protein
VTETRSGPLRVSRRRKLRPGPELFLDARAELDSIPDLSDPVRADLALLVAEVVGNAARHSGTGAQASVGLLIEAAPAVVRVEVRDAGSGFDPVEPARAPPEATGGRGLWMVEQVADRWGAERLADGFLVWFELWTGMARTRHILRGGEQDDVEGLSDSDLKGLIADLTARERVVSEERTRLHARLRALAEEIERRRS